jgi:hypothetical protein
MSLQERMQKQQEKARVAVGPYLAPGERPAAILLGMRPSYWWTLLGVLPYLLIATYYFLVVTNQGVLVIQVSKYKSYAPKRLVARYSHADMQIGSGGLLGVVAARVGDKSYSITGAKFQRETFANARQTLSAGASADSAA